LARLVAVARAHEARELLAGEGCVSLPVRKRQEPTDFPPGRSAALKGRTPEAGIYALEQTSA